MEKKGLNIDVEDFIERTGMANAYVQGEECFFSCPFDGHAHGDSTPSCSMNLETTAFYCFGCHRKHNAITFLAELENISNTQAYKYIVDIYTQDFIEPQTTLLDEIDNILNREEEPEPEQTYIDDHKYDSTYKAIAPANTIPYNYMVKERKFTERTLLHFMIRADDTHIAIPVLDSKGIVGVKGRAISTDFKPKYLVKGTKEGHQRYNVNDFLYNIDQVKHNSDVIVVEGELNAVAMYQMGFPNTVAFGGTALGKKQIQALIETARTVTILFDSDEAGRNSTEALIRILEPHMQVFTIDVDHLDPSDILKNSSSQENAQEAINELLRNKINTIERYL